MYRHEDEERAAPATKPYSSSYPDVDATLWPLLKSYLQHRDLDPSLALFNGWYPSSNAGDTGPRLVIPCYSQVAENCYWQARRMVEPSGQLAGADRYVRYQSPHGVRRGDAIVRVIPHRGKPLGTVIAEGPMDAMAAAGAGFVGVALMGLNPGLEALQTAGKVAGNTRVLVVADEGALGPFTAVWGHFPGAELKTTYPYKDLAEVPKAERGKYLA